MSERLLSLKNARGTMTDDRDGGLRQIPRRPPHSIRQGRAGADQIHRDPGQVLIYAIERANRRQKPGPRRRVICAFGPSLGEKRLRGAAECDGKGRDPGMAPLFAARSRRKSGFDAATSKGRSSLSHVKISRPQRLQFSPGHARTVAGAPLHPQPAILRVYAPWPRDKQTSPTTSGASRAATAP